MYCKYCGRWTDNANGVCGDCSLRLSQQNTPQRSNYQQSNYPVVYQAPSQYTRMYGFTPALVATILGAVGAVVAYVGMVLAMIPYTAAEGLAVSLVGLGMGVPALILGIKAIGRFKEGNRHGMKPLPTLILGITGLSCGALALLFGTIGFLLGAVSL